MNKTSRSRRDRRRGFALAGSSVEFAGLLDPVYPVPADPVVVDVGPPIDVKPDVVVADVVVEPLSASRFADADAHLDDDRLPRSGPKHRLPRRR